LCSTSRPCSDLASEPTLRGVDHGGGHVDAVHLSCRSDPAQQQLDSDAAPEPEVGEHPARTYLQRIGGGGDRTPVAAVEHSADKPPGQSVRVAELAGKRGESAVAKTHDASLWRRPARCLARCDATTAAEGPCPPQGAHRTGLCGLRAPHGRPVVR